MAYTPRTFRKDDVLRAADLEAMNAEIRRLGQVRVSGGLSMHSGPGGLTIGGPTIPTVQSAVVTTAITAAPDADTLGQGQARLRSRTGAALVDGPIVRVYSNFSVLIPVGKRIEVGPDGADYKLLGSDCVTS